MRNGRNIDKKVMSYEAVKRLPLGLFAVTKKK
jgi:hypothetical protein